MEIKIDGSKKIDGNRNRYKWKLSVFFSLATHFIKSHGAKFNESYSLNIKTKKSIE